MNDHADETARDPAEQTGPEYRAPVLVDLGTFHDLTQGGVGGGPDGLEGVS
jgi:hypothetical protein